MHIAVCDDNIADRKQTERLLGRQSDRFFKESGERLYIDSYGNVEAFLRYPQMYDGLFIDITTGSPTGFEIVKILLDAGIVRPIILCVSTIDYRKEYQESGLDIPNLMFIDKPIRVAELTSIMDEIRRIKGDPIPTLELRGKEGAFYAKNDDIVYAKKKGAEVIVQIAFVAQVHQPQRGVAVFGFRHYVGVPGHAGDVAALQLHVARTPFDADRSFGDHVFQRDAARAPIGYEA